MACGSWIDLSVRLFSVPRLAPIHVESLGCEVIPPQPPLQAPAKMPPSRQAVPRSLLFYPTDTKTFLLCALSDGRLVSYVLSVSAADGKVQAEAAGLSISACSSTQNVVAHPIEGSLPDDGASLTAAVTSTTDERMHPRMLIEKSVVAIGTQPLAFDLFSAHHPCLLLWPCLPCANPPTGLNPVESYPCSLEPRDNLRAMDFPIVMSHAADGPPEPSHYLRKRICAGVGGALHVFAGSDRPAVVHEASGRCAMRSCVAVLMSNP